MKKNKLKEPTNPEYLSEFLIDSCKSEAIHSLSAILAIFIFFFIPLPYRTSIALPVFITNFICHILPSIIQRYMRPRLIKIYEISKKRNAQQNLYNEENNAIFEDETDDDSIKDKI